MYIINNKMSYENLELDINNYNFNELLRVYEINEENFFRHFADNKTSFKNKIEKIKLNLDNKYYIFYKKVYKILSIVHRLFSDDLNIRNKTDVIVNIIKSIDNFDLTDDELILKKVNDFFIASKPIIQQEKPNIIISTNNNNVSPGLLNSIKRVTQKSNFYLNSMFRQNYSVTTPTNFYYDLPVEVKNVVALSLASIELPNSWYTISSKINNNSFKIITKNGSTIKSWDIIIEDGNYTSDSFQTYLNDNYLYMSPDYASTELANIKYIVNEITAKSVFEVVIPSSTFSFDIIFNNYDNINNSDKKNFLSIGWIMGFRKLEYLKINNKLTSEALLDCAGDRYIYFSLNDFQYNKNANNIICFKDNTADNNILAKIPLSFGKYSVVIDNTCGSLSKTRIYNGPVTIKRIHVVLYDKYGNVIDLNEMDFSFTLEFEILYEGFNFDNINY